MIINNFLLIIVLINLFIFFNFEKLFKIILFKFDILDHPNTKLKKHSESEINKSMSHQKISNVIKILFYLVVFAIN